MTDDLVVIRVPTIQDGTVVKWYVSVEAAEQGTEILNASRQGVLIGQQLIDSAAKYERLRSLLDRAMVVSQRLRAERAFADVAVPTHDRKVGGAIVPIATVPA